MDNCERKQQLIIVFYGDLLRLQIMLETNKSKLKSVKSFI